MATWVHRPCGEGVELPAHLPLLPAPILPSTCRALRGKVCASLLKRKLSISSHWKSYQLEKLVRTPTLIVLNSSEICHARVKGMIRVIASVWDSPGPQASYRAAALRAAAVRRGRIANLVIFKLTPGLLGFWFSLGTTLKFLVTKVYGTCFLKFVLTSLSGWRRIYSDISSVIQLLTPYPGYTRLVVFLSLFFLKNFFSVIQSSLHKKLSHEIFPCSIYLLRSLESWC